MSEGAASGFTDSASKGLQTKVGGVPIYIIGIFVVGGVWAFRKYQAAKTPDVPAVTQDVNRPGQVITGAGTAGSGAGSVYSPVPSSGATSGINSSNQAQSPVDASAWVSMGTAFLATLGYDGTKANQYLSSFASGTTPTAEGARYVNLVLNKYGPPKTVQSYTSVPVTGAKIVRFVRPAGKWGTFAQYDDGSLVWLGDGVATGNALNSAAAAGMNTTVVELPINDPVWRNSDVVRDNNPYYLWAEKWASYTQPTKYLGNRGDIITDPNTVQEANAAWQRTYTQVLSVSPPPGVAGAARQQYDDRAVAAAFPTGVNGRTV